jgi:O-antigen/teichoic acid export membrane protein
MFRNIALLSAGSGTAQLILLAATPLLSRLYLPDDFGVLAVILAVSAIVIPFSTLRYENAILIRSDEYPPASLLLLCVVILCAFTLILVPLNRYVFNQAFTSEEIPAFAQSLITIYVFILGLNSILTAWHSRFKRFKIISIALLVQSLCTVSAQSFFGLNSIPGGLVYGHLGGLISYAVILMLASMRLDYSEIINIQAIRKIRHAAIKQKQFPIYSTWSALLNGMANNLPNILFSKLFTTAAAGHYAMATRLIRNPMSIIGQAVYQVVAQHAGEHHNQRLELCRVLNLVLRRMAYIAILPFILMSLFLVTIITYILGAQWAETGSYARILLPWLFLTYITWPLTGTYNALGKQGRLLIFNAIFVAGILIAFSSLLIDKNIITVLLLLSLCGSASRFYYLYWLFAQLDSPEVKDISAFMLTYTAVISLFAVIGQVLGW